MWVGRVGRDVYRKKLERYLACAIDEAMVSLVATVAAVHSGNRNALLAVTDLPPEALGADIGSPY